MDEKTSGKYTVDVVQMRFDSKSTLSKDKSQINRRNIHFVETQEKDRSGHFENPSKMTWSHSKMTSA